jgi:hypothetical protein
VPSEPTEKGHVSGRRAGLVGWALLALVPVLVAMSPPVWAGATPPHVIETSSSTTQSVSLTPGSAVTIEPPGGSRAACINSIVKEAKKGKFGAYTSSAVQSAIARLESDPDVCTQITVGMSNVTSKPSKKQIKPPPGYIGNVSNIPPTQIAWYNVYACDGNQSTCDPSAWTEQATFAFLCDQLWAQGGGIIPIATSWPFWSVATTAKGWWPVEAGFLLPYRYVVGRDFFEVSVGIGPLSKHWYYRLWLNGYPDCGAYGSVTPAVQG